MELTLFVSKVTGDEKNCSYPYKVVVNNPDELKDAVRFDHVCVEYRNGYRRNSNFVVSDCAVMDCDNDASDDAVWHEENTTIDVFIAKRAQQTSHVIPARKRNATLC